MRVTLSSVSRKAAYYLGKNLCSSPDKIEIYAYGLEILLGAAIKLLVIVVGALCWGTFNTTMVLLVTYAALRWFGGGAHMSSYFKCFLSGTIIIVGLGKVSQFNLRSPTLTELTIFTIVFAVYVCLRWAPGDSEKKPIRDKQIRLRQKRKMIVIIVIYGLVILYSRQCGQLTYVLAMILGCISSVFLITPWGYRLFAVVDKLTQNGGDHDESKIAEVSNEFAGNSPGFYCRNRSQA